MSEGYSPVNRDPQRFKRLIDRWIDLEIERS